ncbi:hypothetical protein RJ640_001071 [Escallonia rubra]|uniref:Uncharacterized protein n=1 Tax=Escallonia rubra TaxID=112253 RepID=A0AA88QEM1_9ASTE|nr:hypothetical protein RJ640_001071 [Escallonia rubra]
MSMGVPIAAWLMYSDQPRNALLITKVLRTGIAVRDWDRRDELVPSPRIQEAVETLMVSKEGDKEEGSGIGHCS